ncbi:MAG: DUF3618 domain-containing protein [Verrucomicrobiota bacterium]
MSSSSEDHENETDALRSDIDDTRRRMNETMEALGERMQPRHLLDEALGYFRRHDSKIPEHLTDMREKLSTQADSAVHAVVDTIKKNPIPALLIGAGIAWMLFNRRRSAREEAEEHNYDDHYEETSERLRYDPDAHLDRPLEYPSGGSPDASDSAWDAQGGSRLDRIKETIGEKTQSARESLSHAGEVAREKLSAARERAGELGARAKERAGELYTRTRDGVAHTVEQRPLETGLVCLAVGVVAGLALPTPGVVNRRLGPTADRLRDRARESGQEILEKGRRVATAAMSAAKQEAKSQGLTSNATASASGSAAAPAPEGNQSGSQLDDPTLARPAV